LVRLVRKDHLDPLEYKDPPDPWVQEGNVVKKVHLENRDHLDWVVVLETKDPLDLPELWDQLEHLVYLVLRAKLDH
jgi:hypothetical protein